MERRRRRRRQRRRRSLHHFCAEKKSWTKFWQNLWSFLTRFQCPRADSIWLESFLPNDKTLQFLVAKRSLTIIASNDIRDSYYSWVSRFVADLTKAPESTVGSSPNVSLNCLNNIHSSFYLTWYFSKSPQSQQSFGLLLQTQICCQDLSKTPILVGLAIGSIPVTMTLAS